MFIYEFNIILQKGMKKEKLQQMNNGKTKKVWYKRGKWAKKALLKNGSEI